MVGYNGNNLKLIVVSFYCSPFPMSQFPSLGYHERCSPILFILPFGFKSNVGHFGNGVLRLDSSFPILCHPSIVGFDYVESSYEMSVPVCGTPMNFRDCTNQVQWLPDSDTASWTCSRVYSRLVNILSASLPMQETHGLSGCFQKLGQCT